MAWKVGSLELCYCERTPEAPGTNGTNMVQGGAG